MNYMIRISVKFLEVIKPFCGILPEVAKPERKVSEFCNIVILYALNSIYVNIYKLFFSSFIV